MDFDLALARPIVAADGTVLHASFPYLGYIGDLSRYALRQEIARQLRNTAECQSPISAAVATP